MYCLILVFSLSSLPAAANEALVPEAAQDGQSLEERAAAIQERFMSKTVDLDAMSPDERTLYETLKKQVEDSKNSDSTDTDSAKNPDGTKDGNDMKDGDDAKKPDSEDDEDDSDDAEDVDDEGFAGLDMDNLSLEGMEKLACEALLCLSSASPPSECAPALNAYFGIKYKKSSKTSRKRQQFLNLCPKK